MKRFNFYLSLMLLLVFTAACSDEFDQPPMVIPTAEHTPNMTIAEFKAKHWQDMAGLPAVTRRAISTSSCTSVMELLA